MSKLSDSTDRPVDLEGALTRLARRLFEVVERLDPGYGTDWESLTDLERDFFYPSVKSLLLQSGDVLRVLEVQSPDDRVIDRHFSAMQ